MLNRQTALLALATVVVPAVTLTACSEGTQVASVRKGAVPLEQIRVGTPDAVFKDAIATFVQDPKGTMGDKVQYLSRAYDEDGGQYVAQVKNDQCFEVDVVATTKPISREAAVKKIEHLLPPDVVAANKPTVKEKGNIEALKYGDAYRGVITYSDASKSNVVSISALRTKQSM